MKKIGLYLLILTNVIAACSSEKKEKESNYTQYVNPFIGTSGHGHTFPGATMPFGMVQLSPDTRLDGWDGCSGYHYSDTVVYGFSHTHLSGTGVSDYGDVLLMPSTCCFFETKFDKKTEVAEPGYYGVHLSDQNIKVDLTVTKRAGFHKYTFAQTDSQYVLLNLFHRDIATDYRINEVSKSSISGFRISKAWAEEQHIYFYIEFSRAFDFSVPGPENEMAWYVFQNPETAELLVKVGISAVSIENAKANLEAEIPHWDFEQTKAEAQQAWNKQLGKIEVQGAEEDKVKFYTALYHTMIAPNLYTDVNGDYRGMDMKIHNTEGDKDQYTVFSLWDTFRATHPLFTIIEQDRTNAFVQTFLRQYEQGGLLPVWELAANETYCMIGYHSAPVIVDAYLKGIHDFDAEKALEAMVNSANQDHFGLEFYKKQGLHQRRR
jgi:predicted alpha-1,2-mannosidase